MQRDAFDRATLELAIEEFSKAIALNPQLAEAYYERGVAYGNMVEYERAIADLSEAIRINPQYAEAYFSRAVGYELIGRLDQAIADLEKAIELGLDSSREQNARESLDKLRQKVGESSLNPTPESPSAGTAAPPEQPTREQVVQVQPDDWVRGPGAAAVTFIEWGDFQ